MYNSLSLCVVCDACYVYITRNVANEYTSKWRNSRKRAYLDEPDLVVDGVELLLEHEGQRLGVRVPGRADDVGRAAEQALVVAVALGVARHVERLLDVGQDVGLLELLPLLLGEGARDVALEVRVRRCV